MGQDSFVGTAMGHFSVLGTTGVSANVLGVKWAEEYLSDGTYLGDQPLLSHCPLCD